jgi:hypothetical protein
MLQKQAGENMTKLARSFESNFFARSKNSALIRIFARYFSPSAASARLVLRFLSFLLNNAAAIALLSTQKSVRFSRRTPQIRNPIFVHPNNLTSSGPYLFNLFAGHNAIAPSLWISV